MSIEISVRWCPQCFARGHAIKLRLNTTNGRYRCIYCGHGWTSGEVVDAEFAMIGQEVAA
jgi:hypothetical protein